MQKINHLLKYTDNVYLLLLTAMALVKSGE